MRLRVAIDLPSGAARPHRSRARADPRRDPAVGGAPGQLGRLSRLPGQGRRRRRGRRDADRAPGPPAHGPARRDRRPRTGPRGRASIPSGPSSSGSGIGSGRSSSGPARKGARRRPRAAVRGVPGGRRRAGRDRRGGARRRASTSRPTAFAGWRGRSPRATPATRWSTRTRRIPKLQELFRFRDPDGPPRRIRRKPATAPRSWLPSWLSPSSAHADEADEWRELSERLDRWVPASNELPAYREIVDRLLTLAAERSFDGEALDARFDDLFRDLVKTVAWQESCWRQFVRDRSGVVPIQSSTGDFGMMQINVRVWRGFFNPVKLRWSAGYNAGAGAEILWQLLGRYGVREARERLSNAARSSYSAYHGGPAALPPLPLARHPAGDAARRPGVLGQVPGDERGPGGRPRPLHAREAHVLTGPRAAAIGSRPGAASTRLDV